MPDLLYETLKYLLQSALRSEANPAAHAKASDLLEQLEAIKAEEIAEHAERVRIVEELHIEMPKTGVPLQDLMQDPFETSKPESSKA
jgi:hypothetical protein